MTRDNHGHSHALAATATGTHRRRLMVVLAITVTVLVVQVVGGLFSGSLALLADAGHMATDAAGITAALVAASLAARPATNARTYGLHAPRSWPRWPMRCCSAGWRCGCSWRPLGAGASRPTLSLG